MKPLFEHPDLSYVEMCMHIDENIMRSDLTDEEETTIFQYLYLIIHMLAYKQQYFQNLKQYEDFAVYGATRIYMRYQASKAKGSTLKPVKSVLNYIKKTINFLRIDFTQSEYSQCGGSTEEEVEECNSEYSFRDKMSDSIDALSMVEFNCCLGDIIKTAKAFLKQIPYYSDKKTWLNIYTSCMLTFLNSVTLPRRKIEQVRNLKESAQVKERYLDDLYIKEAENSTILYHLDESMRDYITVLTRELKHAIAKDLSLQSSTYVSGNSGVRMLIEDELRHNSQQED